jgi:hypothetical protein
MSKRILCYTHPPTTGRVQKADARPGPYYVSVVDGTRTGLLLGPFKKHQRALDAVPAARAKAEDLDPRAHWYAYGTVRMARGYTNPGRLNSFLGELLEVS